MKLARGLFLVSVVIFYSIGIASSQISFADEKNISGNIEPAIEDGQDNIEVDHSINIQKLNNESYDIRIILDHIFISERNNSLEVSEIVVFRNEGTETYYIKDDHTYFAISTPPGIKDLKTDVMECCLVEEEGVVFMDPMQPMKPGDNFEMKISYTLLSLDPEQKFKKYTMYNTTSLSVFINKKGSIGAEGTSGTLTLQGDEFDVISFKELKIGEVISVPVQISEKPGRSYAGIGLFFLFSTGLVYIFKKKIIPGRRKQFTLEELELEKKKIFKTIYSFEKHAGSERSEEYERLIDEYKEKVIQIFIKIDKVKSKDKSAL